MEPPSRKRVAPSWHQASKMGKRDGECTVRSGYRGPSTSRRGGVASPRMTTRDVNSAAKVFSNRRMSLKEAGEVWLRKAPFRVWILEESSSRRGGGNVGIAQRFPSWEGNPQGFPPSVISTARFSAAGFRLSPSLRAASGQTVCLWPAAWVARLQYR